MKGFECFTVSCLEKIFPNRVPEFRETQNVCFSNEIFSFQVAFFDSTHDFLLQRGHWHIEGTLKDFVQIRPVYCVPETLPCLAGSDDYYLTKGSEIVPDLLAEEDFFVVRLGQWGGLWVTVSGNLPEGNHKICISLQMGEETVGNVEYNLKVEAEELPESNIKYAHWMHYDCIAQQHGVMPDDEKFLNLLKNYLKNSAAHGVNVCFVPLFTPPLNTAVGKERMTIQLVDVEEKGGKYIFGFERVLRFMKQAEECGMKYFEMSHLFSQWGALHPPKIIAKCGAVKKQIFGWDDDSLGEKYVLFLKQFLSDFSCCLRSEGYDEDRVFFHISDEPNVKSIERYIKIKKIVCSSLQGYKIMDALSDYDFYLRGGVEIPVSTTDHACDFLSHGVDNLWVYYCCGHGGQYLSNRFLSMPLQRTRILGYQLYLCGCKGFLHWGYNYYNSALSERIVNPYVVTDADGSFPSGDSFIVYPGMKGPLDSIRHETMFDAIQDYRMLLLLEKKIGRKETCLLLQKEGIKSFNEYPRSAYQHMEIRKKIISQILS